MSTADASDSTSNNELKSGIARTDILVIAVLRLSKAAVASVLHMNLSFFNRDVNYFPI